MVQGSKVSDQLSNQIKEIVHKPIEQQLKSLEKAIKQSNVITADTASKVVDEYRDMERRKWNLIVFNVPEPKSTESSQRKVEFFNSLIDHIGIDPVDVTNVVRLGAKTSDKLRPLRVQLNNLGHRRSVLANAKKLRNSSSDIFKRIYINPDLSVKERQAQKKLRSELARRKENGETDIFIRRGRIMKPLNSDHSQGSTSELMDDQSA